MIDRMKPSNQGEEEDSQTETYFCSSKMQLKQKAVFSES